MKHSYLFVVFLTELCERMIKNFLHYENTQKSLQEVNLRITVPESRRRSLSAALVLFQHQMGALGGNTA